MARSAAARMIFFMGVPYVDGFDVRCFGGPAADDRLLRTWIFRVRLTLRAGGPGWRPSLRGGLGVHVDDLDAAVARVHRRVRIDRLGFAITDGDEVGAIDAIPVDEVALDGIGAALGEVLVVAFAADRIGVAGDHDGRTLEAG